MFSIYLSGTSAWITPRVRGKLIGWENWVGMGSIPTQRSPLRVWGKLIGWGNWVETGSIPTQRLPPRVRGKRCCQWILAPLAGITPACAGNMLYYIALECDSATEDVDMIQLFAGVDHRRILGVLGQEL